MKLLSQESSPWSYSIIGGQCIGTREHTLRLVELASEFSFERFIPYVGSINSVEFGGVPAGRLMFSISGVSDGDVWNIKVQLVESEEHWNRPLDFMEPNTGRIFTVTTPRYRESDFRDFLPRVEPFPDTTFTGSYSVLSVNRN